MVNIRDKPSPPPEAPPWQQLSSILAELQNMTNSLAELPTISRKLDSLAALLRGPYKTVVKEGLPWPESEPYSIVEKRLDEARDKERIDYAGDIIIASTNGALSGIEVRLENKRNDAIPLDRFNPVQYPRSWEKFFLTNTIQSGKKLWLFVGRDAGASSVTERTVAAPKAVFYTAKSDKDSHFTGGLTQYAKEDENINGLLVSKLRLLDIAILADQPLDFWLLFWRKDTFDSSDLDKNAFIGAVEFDLSTFGLQVGGSGPYYMSLEDVNLDYEDEDESRELHVSLFNADVTAKTAGAAGEVVIYFKYDLRGS